MSANHLVDSVQAYRCQTVNDKHLVWLEAVSALAPLIGI